MESIIKSYEDIIDLDKASKYNLTDKSNMGNFFKKVFIQKLMIM